MAFFLPFFSAMYIICCNLGTGEAKAAINAIEIYFVTFILLKF